MAQGVFLLETFAGDLNPKLNRRLLNRRARWGRFAGFVFLVMDRVFAAPTDHPQFDILTESDLIPQFSCSPQTRVIPVAYRIMFRKDFPRIY